MILPFVCLLALISENAIQKPIDKLGRIISTVPFRQLNRLVDGNSTRRFSVENLKGANANDVAVNDRHSTQTPIRRSLPKHLVQFTTVAAYSADQALSKFDEGGIIVQTAADKQVGGVHIAIGVDIVFVENLQSDFAGAAATSHRGKPVESEEGNGASQCEAKAGLEGDRVRP